MVGSECTHAKKIALPWKRIRWLTWTLMGWCRRSANTNAGRTKLKTSEGPSRVGDTLGMDKNAYHLAATGPSAYKKVL